VAPDPKTRWRPAALLVALSEANIQAESFSRDPLDQSYEGRWGRRPTAVASFSEVTSRRSCSDSSSSRCKKHPSKWFWCTVMMAVSDHRRARSERRRSRMSKTQVATLPVGDLTVERGLLAGAFRSARMRIFGAFDSDFVRSAPPDMAACAHRSPRRKRGSAQAACGVPGTESLMHLTRRGGIRQ
jgi:hypothetical protein